MPVKDAKDLIKKARADVVRTMDSLAYHLYNYVDRFVYEAYRKECTQFWPIIDPETKEPLKNPDTGEAFLDDENPTRLAYLLRGSHLKTDEYSRAIKVWVDTVGLDDADALIKIGRLMEVYGCRPWSRLKSELSSADQIKKAAELSKSQEHKMIFGKL